MWWDEISDLRPRIPEQKLYLLALMLKPITEVEESTESNELYCVILQAIGEARGQYRRIGLFSIYGSYLPKKLLQDSKSALLPEELYQKVDEEMRYTIEIV